jgi:hypothetical protein
VKIFPWEIKSTRGSQQAIMPLFISCCLQFGYMKISQNISTALLKAQLVFNILLIIGNSRLLNLERAYFFPGKSHSCSTATAGAHHFPVPHY